MSTHPAQEPLTMPSRSLGPDHLAVSPIGIGCMGMTWAYGKTDRSESIATIYRALDLGVTLFDTVQSELSLWTRDVLMEILPFCRQHDIGFLAFSPLGRGFLTGRYDQATSFAKDDFRSVLPRFQPDALKANVRIVDSVKELAARREATPAQIALAWVLAQGEHVVAIPGASKRKHLEENLGGAFVQLTEEELTWLDQVPAAAGGRY